MLQFPEPPSLNKLEIGSKEVEAKMDEKLVDNYSLERPHPGFGKDPNILNELGHSVYPKMVYPKGNQHPGKLVNNAQEEEEALGKPVEQPTVPNTGNGWGE